MTSPELTPQFSDEPPDPPEGFPPTAGRTTDGSPTNYVAPLDEFGDVFNALPPGAIPEGEDPWT